ncbi:MAG: PEP-CTERM sorting domain-containing protein [Chitinivibrionales bacterium]|nr:PEP-CTERM sorting domain-containing protein [Chitinivibrionales bacterium]
MVRKVVAGLAVVSFVIVASACAIVKPELVAQSTWVDGSTTHYYDVFEYFPAITGLDKQWITAETYVTGNYPGWTLASITSQAEQNQINALMNGANLTNPCGGEYWIGAYQDANVPAPYLTGWHWVTGEAWDYTNWRKEERPGDLVEPSGDGRYIGTWSYLNDGWVWNDEGNIDNIGGFISERIVTAVPEPATLSLIGLSLLSLVGFSFKRKRK